MNPAELAVLKERPSQVGDVEAHRPATNADVGHPVIPAQAN